MTSGLAEPQNLYGFYLGIWLHEILSGLAEPAKVEKISHKINFVATRQ